MLNFRYIHVYIYLLFIPVSLKDLQPVFFFVLQQKIFPKTSDLSSQTAIIMQRPPGLSHVQHPLALSLRTKSLFDAPLCLRL